jgi:phospholipid/cholesterol/gamma-HCH transport system substrate-binding protein
MERSEFIKKFLAGLFFVLGIGILVGVVFIIGLERGFSEPKFQVTVLFKEIGGLGYGAPIRISGLAVGNVGGIEFLNQEIAGKSLKVTLNIYQKYEQQFKKCSKIAIKTEGVLGEKFIEISSDPQMPPFDLSEPILGQDLLDVEDVAKVMAQTATSLQGTAENANVLLEDLESLSQKGRRLMNRLEEKVMEGNLFKVF